MPHPPQTCSSKHPQNASFPFTHSQDTLQPQHPAPLMRRFELQSLMKLAQVIWNFPGQGFCFHLCNQQDLPNDAAASCELHQLLLKVITWGQNVSNELWWGPATGFLLKNVHSKGKKAPTDIILSFYFKVWTVKKYFSLFISFFKRHHCVLNGKACKKPPQKPNITQISRMKVLTASASMACESLADTPSEISPYNIWDVPHW